MLTTAEFYHDPHVLRRMLEYCGVPVEETADFELEPGTTSFAKSRRLREIAGKMTAEYLSGWGDYFLRTKGKRASSRYPEQLGELLDGGLNIFRSVWDRQKIIFLLDVEYVSHKFPLETYTNPWRVFNILEPVYKCLQDVFSEYGIKPMTLATAQGYHFVFEVNSFTSSGESTERREITPVARKLVQAGFLEDTLRGKYTHPIPHKKRRRVLDPELGRAFDTVGKLLEFISHKAIQRLPGYGLKIPVGIGDIVPGNAMQELINLDLSTYADPLFTRVMRTAFSIHDKHKSKGLDLPVHLTIPRYTPCNGNELGLPEIFQNRRHFHNSANYARAITMNIPESSEGVARLLDDYQQSSLATFHQDFDQTAQDPSQDWSRTYDRMNLRDVPPCVAYALANPNPALLQPKQIQTLVRVLTAKKRWHPSHVAGLIRSKYERDHHWEFNWQKYDANRHARTWVRFYAGLLATGVDDRIDQNCVSHQEKDLCPRPFCGYNLADYK